MREEAKAEDEANRAEDATGADPDHHQSHLRRRQGARPPHHCRHLGPRQGSRRKRIDEQATHENSTAMDAGEAEASNDLQPYRTSQAISLHNLVYQSQQQAFKA
ncbi:hypothetical protein Sjap_016971 [Stephania japonica]|uniref:Uncharacterized protein n=1 Tax=Stephania japonica TaxID=461633 RepID=A0AAP0NLG3_9MAGN